MKVDRNFLCANNVRPAVFAFMRLAFSSLLGLASIGNADAQVAPTATQVAIPDGTFLRVIYLPEIHGLATNSLLSDQNPGYAGENVKAILDTTGQLARIHVVSSSNCNVLLPGEKCVVAGSNYYLTSSKLDGIGVHKVGARLVTGVLAVPFKYHFTDHATTAGATLGGYVGVEGFTGNLGSLAWIVGGGLALVPTVTTTTNFAPSAGNSSSAGTTTTTTSTSDSTLHGVSIATGPIGRIGKSKAQFGVLLGWDFVNKSEHYKYDSKPWLSFSFSYAFTN